MITRCLKEFDNIDMDKKIKYVCLAMAMVLGNVAIAQNNNQDKTDLNKNITLEREFDPVKKTVVKKTVLPKEVKKEEKDAVAPQFSDWAVPTLVPVEIPTMEPYGYRTRHNFSNQRGYLFMGLGTCLNLVAGAGYRAIDRTNEKLSVWMLHNSTWLGKNTTKLIERSSDRQKQRFNDNIVGANWMKELNAGTLAIDGHLHFDSFNYYGGFTNYLKDRKTAFFEARADGKWQSEIDINDEKLGYEAHATLDYAGYDKSHLEGIDGSKEFWLGASIESGYEFEKIGDVGMLFGVDVVNRRRHNIVNNVASDKTFAMLTLNPYYKYSNDIFTAKAGGIINLSFNEGTAFRIAPDVDLNFKITKGVNLFAQATGGKMINHLGDLHNAYRYNDPLAGYDATTYVPFDGRIGFNVGPFVGFSAKAYVGYGFMTGQLDAVVPAANSGIYKEVLDMENPKPDGPNSPYIDGNQYAAIIYKMTKCQGAYMGIEASYKYRSLAEANLQFVHTFTSDEDYVDGMRYTGYPLGDDGPTSIFNIDVKVWPIKPLMVNAGLNCRINRSTFIRRWVTPVIADDGTLVSEGFYNYDDLEMKDVINLYVSARYNFSHIFSVWAQANNLLCKQWDIMPGQGAQKIGLMGGISVNF
jgi:hypothetical protein